MLKALLLLLMNLALAAMATAQTNLVLNGSFEDTVDCDVPMASRLPKAAHWYNPTQGTPDLFDCDLDRVCGLAMDLPYWNGFMFSQDGLRHAGAFFWDDPPDGHGREYLMTELAQVLTQGMSYEVSLWYSSHRPAQYGVDHIGVWLGSDSVHADTSGPMSLSPQLQLRDPQNVFLGESEVWMRLLDTIVAQGDERWIVIGNFDPVEQVNGILVNPDGFEGFCYYHIDNVVVRPLEPVTVSELHTPKLWWDGSELSLMGCTGSGRMSVEILDVLGAVLYTESLQNTGSPISLNYTPPVLGTYVAVITVGETRFVTKFIK